MTEKPISRHDAERLLAEGRKRLLARLLEELPQAALAGEWSAAVERITAEEQARMVLELAELAGIAHD